MIKASELAHMSLSAIEDAPYYPPYVKPCIKPPMFPFNLVRMLANNLELIPERAYYEPVTITRGPPRIAFCTGSELVKTLLVNRHADFPKGGPQVEILKPMWGNGIASAEGPEWRWQKSAAAPLFQHEELLRHGPIISAAAEAMIAKWRSAAPGSIHSIDLDMMRATFRVISNTILAGGAEEVLSALERGHAEYYSGADWWVMYTLLGIPHWFPRPGGKAMRAHERQMRRAVVELVKARRATGAAGDDLLARMLRAFDPKTGRAMSDELVVDNILSFLVAGYDTTALLLTWTLYLIAHSPSWEQRLLREIEQVVGLDPVTSAHVQQLVTVQQVLNESLRLFPTAPIIVRDIVHDMEFAGISVPAGTIGLIPVYAIHRHRSYWDDPNRFDPDRFAPSNWAKSMRFQFMPFGAGPRTCMGAAFVMIEATIMIATFIRAARFEVDPTFDPKPTVRLFLLPRNGMPMRVKMRTAGAPHRYNLSPG
jgi:cytochrome P450